MNALRNKVQLIGNLGNAPEVRNTESGKKLVKFSVATNEVYNNNKGEKVKETQWHNVIAWGKVAEIAEKYLHTKPCSTACGGDRKTGAKRAAPARGFCLRFNAIGRLASAKRAVFCDRRRCRLPAGSIA